MGTDVIKAVMVLCISFIVILVRIATGLLELQDNVHAYLPVRLRCRAMAEAQAGTFVEPAISIYCGLSPMPVCGGALRFVKVVQWKSNSCLLISILPVNY